MQTCQSNTCQSSFKITSLIIFGIICGLNMAIFNKFFLSNFEYLSTDYLNKNNHHYLAAELVFNTKLAIELVFFSLFILFISWAAKLSYSNKIKPAEYIAKYRTYLSP